MPVGAVALACSGFAIAYAATDSGSDTPHDVAERALEPTTTTADDVVTTTTTGGPAAASDAERTEAFDFVNLPDGSTQTFVAGDAGTVTIARSGSTLTVVAVGANPGWVTEIEAQSGPEVEVVFRNGARRIDLEAELEDGAVRVRVRERIASVADDDDDDVVTPPTRVDSSGPGSENSGPGSVDSGGDEGRDDESHSGSGSGSSGSGSGSSGSGSSGSDD